MAKVSVQLLHDPLTNPLLSKPIMITWLTTMARCSSMSQERTVPDVTLLTLQLRRKVRR